MFSLSSASCEQQENMERRKRKKMIPFLSQRKDFPASSPALVFIPGLIYSCLALSA